MNARQTTEAHATKLQDLLGRMQTATTALKGQTTVRWGHAADTHEALRCTVAAAFALGVVSEDEARELGFPV